VSYATGKRHPGSQGWRFLFGSWGKLAKLVVLDNYDSFTHNLVQMFMYYPLDISVHRADKVCVKDIRSMSPDYLLISPGPKGAGDSGVSVEAIRYFAGRIPVLGVCLGMQCINEAFGGKTLRAPIPVHGKTSLVHHEKTGLFAGIPSPFTAARYHSLMIDGRGRGLEPCAWTEDGVVMAISDADRMLYGVQFHPESFMTEKGFVMVENFLGTGVMFCPEKML
jgi:anthranilate synthase component 2